MFDVPQVQWSESHGATNNHQSMGALYFSLPYMLKAERCVILGSGAGYVPLMVLAAQRKLIQENIIDKVDVTLIDANIGIWGLPLYKSGSEIDPELILVKELTADAASSFSEIDYLHIDADHSYEGVKSDLESYFPRLCKKRWAITVHDTDNPAAANDGLPLGAWEACMDFANEHRLAIVNFRIGCGTALIMPGHEAQKPLASRMFARLARTARKKLLRRLSV
jgi:hypothetical protein